MYYIPFKILQPYKYSSKTCLWSNSLVNTSRHYGRSQNTKIDFFGPVFRQCPFNEYFFNFSRESLLNGACIKHADLGQSGLNFFSKTRNRFRVSSKIFETQAQVRVRFLDSSPSPSLRLKSESESWTQVPYIVTTSNKKILLFVNYINQKVNYINQSTKAQTLAFNAK